MSKVRASRGDPTADKQIEAVAEFVKSNLENPAIAIPKFIGGLSARDIVDITYEKFGKHKTTGAFYDRWDSSEDFQEALTKRLTKDAFSSPEAVRVIRGGIDTLRQYHPDQKPLKEDVLESLTDRCAEGIAESDPNALIRWHLRPYASELDVDDQLADMTQLALETLDLRCGFEPMTLPAYTRAAEERSIIIDHRAIGLINIFR